MQAIAFFDPSSASDSLTHSLTHSLVGWSVAGWLAGAFRDSSGQLLVCPELPALWHPAPATSPPTNPPSNLFELSLSLSLLSSRLSALSSPNLNLHETTAGQSGLLPTVDCTSRQPIEDQVQDVGLLPSLGRAAARLPGKSNESDTWTSRNVVEVHDALTSIGQLHYSSFGTLLLGLASVASGHQSRIRAIEQSSRIRDRSEAVPAGSVLLRRFFEVKPSLI
ncbi:hypothetical protein MPTK1_3g06590 [Marchantia polymorpha subsp. ruderalis]|uniref:Uncharacterized protein n=2 Tax=Marchantia polymorpha TaxID=3197 RepID=A0AAF6AY26_MARPO|nr:hypothetical protein MARPO_0006s0128 [Marchantia polymorpha]BBN04660.1 hypothetical protein Mp_3g06590 [Marchantia polymorpha subsp. ruderalis]|eukprot:PTQ48098.1 hypothetical protein MARPO_0006s0128 [Marchantia polymorpha]